MWFDIADEGRNAKGFYFNIAFLKWFSFSFLCSHPVKVLSKIGYFL